MPSVNICVCYASRRICKLVLFYSMVPIGLYSLLLPFYALRGAEVKRITNQNDYVAGERFVSTITIKRKFPFPLLYLVIEDELPPHLTSCRQTKMNKTILFPGLKRNISFQYAIDTIPRGEHTFSIVRVKTGDLFSMMEKEVTFQFRIHFSLSSVCRYNVSAIGKPFRTRSALSKYKFHKRLYHFCRCERL